MMRDWRTWFMAAWAVAAAMAAAGGYLLSGAAGSVTAVAFSYLFTGVVIVLACLDLISSIDEAARLAAMWLPALFSERMKAWTLR